MAEVHLQLARVAATAGDWATAATNTRKSRQLAEEAAEPDLAAQADLLDAHAAIGRGRHQQAEAFAGAALATAEEHALSGLACEALLILGRCARRCDLAHAEAYFEEARARAERHNLEIWRVRALFELATIDNFRDPWDATRMLRARAAAERIGALATVATIDLQLAICYTDTGRPETGLESARRTIDASRRLRLSTLPMALAQWTLALMFLGRVNEAEPTSAELGRSAADDRDVQSTIAGKLWGFHWLLHEDRARARTAFEQGMAIAREGVNLVHSFPGLWAVLCTVEDPTDGRATAEVRDSPSTTHASVRVCLQFAEAVTLGHAGHHEDAAHLATAAIQEAAKDPDIVAPLAVRLTAEAALRDGWGEPTDLAGAGAGLLPRHTVHRGRGRMRSTAAAAPTAPRRADRTGGRGVEVGRGRFVQPGNRGGAAAQREDRGPPPREHLHQTRRGEPGLRLLPLRSATDWHSDLFAHFYPRAGCRVARGMHSTADATGVAADLPFPHPGKQHVSRGTS